ncbi:helix-turn-helix domain-containing protein [uncultured Chryseobacterium sp.]|uniref:AraC family transcriptional regulator n=1 Tax=uncultured Chryseobacterium sp. TaxID=259322 RepID=UPI0025E45EC8|nr:helix-turn-helix domain-containing protein [uncultured Chryseobacterium sp.]
MSDSALYSVPSVFYVAGVIIAFFSSLLILGKNKKTGADFVLAVWFVIIGIHLIFFVLFFSELYIRFPHVLGLEVPFPLMHGPMLYLYILYLTGRRPGKMNWLIHLAPVLIIYLFFGKFFTMSPEEKLNVYRQGGGICQSKGIYLKILIILSGVLYVILSIVVIRKYRIKVSELHLNRDKLTLNWVYYLITGIAVIWIAVILKNDFLIFSLVVVFILSAAYFGITRAGILDHPAVAEPVIKENTGNEEIPEVSRYEKTFAGEEIIQQVYDKLSLMMNEEKLYKDPELNLNSVATRINVHPNTLSQTINFVENRNFYDYINRQRIEEFKRIVLLQENEKFTILSLAFESGFNSKTSFNRNFKKYMDCSPREFLKSRQLEIK